MKKIITIGLAAAVVTIAGAVEKETKITMDKVPAAVQTAVKTYASESEIKGVEESDVDGTKVIEFDIEKNGRKSEIAFRPDGKLFSTEEEVALTDCPDAVQKTIAKLGKKGKAGPPEKVVKEGKTSYEVVVEKAGDKEGEKSNTQFRPREKSRTRKKLTTRGKTKKTDHDIRESAAGDYSGGASGKHKATHEG